MWVPTAAIRTKIITIRSAKEPWQICCDRAWHISQISWQTNCITLLDLLATPSNQTTQINGHHHKSQNSNIFQVLCHLDWVGI